MILFVSNTCPRCIPIKNMIKDRTDITILNVSEDESLILKYNLTSVPSLLDGELITNIQEIIKKVRK